MGNVKSCAPQVHDVTQLTQLNQLKLTEGGGRGGEIRSAGPKKLVGVVSLAGMVGALGVI